MIKEELRKSINELEAKGTISANKPIFAEFNDYARDLELDVAFSTFKESKISHAAVQIEEGKHKRVSTISIFLNTTENLKKNKIDPLNSNWNSKYKHTQDLVLKWNELLDKYSYPIDYKSDPMYIFIYSLESAAVVRLVYLCRDNILEWIEKENLNPKPAYLFCSSEPAFNIVYSNKEDFEESKETSQKILKNYINQLLENGDYLNYYEKGKVKFRMLHKEMEGINLYGLSRQD
ncbi:hypothetical protein [Maribacter polysaccharolyticus]|uniref:hypothetical protein n=1 Tax=Maribacter polysaccharolyticus TaxID=3020831 RepID=UPI00237F2E5F|nr:hypothetical protein [Maribacter polysaccharolyticus]MDE3743299.1 hypothetical protein [Maribacter polysaccharolyticus]